jgi:hypothetical protein
MRFAQEPVVSGGVDQKTTWNKIIKKQTKYIIIICVNEPT